MLISQRRLDSFMAPVGYSTLGKQPGVGGLKLQCAAQARQRIIQTAHVAMLSGTLRPYLSHSDAHYRLLIGLEGAAERRGCRCPRSSLAQGRRAVDNPFANRLRVDLPFIQICPINMLSPEELDVADSEDAIVPATRSLVFQELPRLFTTVAAAEEIRRKKDHQEGCPAEAVQVTSGSASSSRCPT